MANNSDDDRGSELASFLQELSGAVADPDDPDEQLAYDGSNEPQKRPLEPDERALLHRIIGVVAREPRWQHAQVVQRTEISAAIGDGTRPQLRILTARERDDLCYMVTHLTSEFEDYHHQPSNPLLAYLESVAHGDIARLNLIAHVVNAREGDIDNRVVVHSADWAPPVAIPAGWWVAAAPRPLNGPITWQDKDHGHGTYYAACPPDQDHDALDWYGRGHEQDAWHVIPADNHMVAGAVHTFLADFGCRAPEEAGTTIAAVARDLGLPWREPAIDTDGSRPGVTNAQMLASTNFPAGIKEISTEPTRSVPAEKPRHPNPAAKRHHPRRR